jgi:ribulose-5-phosphate 4-epimerase/fuculose-1-phosphate aldolase
LRPGTTLPRPNTLGDPLQTPSLDALKREVLAANLELVRHALILSTFGNASGIDTANNQIVIKPSDVD